MKRYTIIVIDDEAAVTICRELAAWHLLADDSVNRMEGGSRPLLNASSASVSRSEAGDWREADLVDARIGEHDVIDRLPEWIEANGRVDVVLFDIDLSNFEETARPVPPALERVGWSQECGLWLYRVLAPLLLGTDRERACLALFYSAKGTVLETYGPFVATERDDAKLFRPAFVRADANGMSVVRMLVRTHLLESSRELVVAYPRAMQIVRAGIEKLEKADSARTWKDALDAMAQVAFGEWTLATLFPFEFGELRRILWNEEAPRAEAVRRLRACLPSFRRRLATFVNGWLLKAPPGRRTSVKHWDELIAELKRDSAFGQWETAAREILGRIEKDFVDLKDLHPQFYEDVLKPLVGVEQLEGAAQRIQALRDQTFDLKPEGFDWTMGRLLRLPGREGSYLWKRDYEEIVACVEGAAKKNGFGVPKREIQLEADESIVTIQWQVGSVGLAEADVEKARASFVTMPPVANQLSMLRRIVVELYEGTAEIVWEASGTRLRLLPGGEPEEVSSEGADGTWYRVSFSRG